MGKIRMWTHMIVAKIGLGRSCSARAGAPSIPVALGPQGSPRGFDKEAMEKVQHTSGQGEGAHKQDEEAPFAIVWPLLGEPPVVHMVGYEQDRVFVSHHGAPSATESLGRWSRKWSR